MQALKNEISIFYLDRPQSANALDLPTAHTIQKQLTEAVRKNEIGFILSSRHPRVFCAGGDLQAYGKMKTKSQGIATNRKIRKALQDISTLPLIVVAAIEGETIGGGCELALSCDWIIASPSASFSFKQVHQHLITGWGGAQRLLTRVRPSVALDWLTSGRPVTAREAFRCGLVDQLCSPGESVDEARSFLNGRARMSPALLKTFKKLARQGGQGETKAFEGLWFGAEHRSILKSRGN